MTSKKNVLAKMLTFIGRTQGHGSAIAVDFCIEVENKRVGNTKISLTNTAKEKHKKVKYITTLPALSKDTSLGKLPVMLNMFDCMRKANFETWKNFAFHYGK